MRLEISDIQKIIPHRIPFLMIDRVLECRPNEKLVAVKNVSINEDYFRGHFPGEQVMPGVLIIEAMAGFVKCKAFVGDKLMAEAQIGFGTKELS